MKVGGRMAHLVATITSLGMIGIGRPILLTRNIKIDGLIRRQDLGFILCHIIMQFLVSTGRFSFVFIC
jgi:hypothetical protein